MIVQSLRRQCGEREARAAEREDFLHPRAGFTIRGTTQLIRAAALNNLPRVQQLIQLGAPLDIVGKRWGSSALQWASYEGHEHVVKALLDGKFEGKGADVEKPGGGGLSPLMCACSSGREAIVRMLLSRGANVAARDGSGYTALFYARTDSMKALLQAHGATL
jgi:ankyrin repeat protein